MKKRTRSILEELNSIHGNKDNDLLVETSANNIIESAINLLTRIHNLYDEKTADDLERKFFNSIRTTDPRKFRKSMQRVIESKQNGRKSL
jgi:hypothetical protein